MRVRPATSWAALLLAAGCGATPAAPPTVTVPGAAAWAEPGTDGPELVVGVPGPDGHPLALGRARGLRLVADEDLGFPRILPFAKTTRTGEQLVFHCVPDASHRAQLQVEATGTGELRMLVVDEVGLETRVREITLDYQFLALEPVAETFVPQLSPQPDLPVGDDGFHLPLAFLRSGSRALAVMPDVEHLAHHRRMPQGLRADPDLRQIRHGLMMQPSRPPGGDSSIAIRGERLEFAHWLLPTNTAVPEVTLDALVDEIWQRVAEPMAQERAAHPMTSAAVALQAFVARSSRSAAIAEASFGWQRQDLLAAQLLGEIAASRGDEALRQSAAAPVRLLLAAPRRSGMLPALVRSDQPRGRIEGGPAAPGGMLRMLDAAWTGWWLLQVPAWLPEESEAIAAATGDLASFLIHNQLESGAFPTWFYEDFLVPERGARFDRTAESAGAALFLAELAANTGNREAEAACRRALSWLEGELRTSGLSDALTSDLPQVATGGCRPASSFGLALAAMASARAIRSSEDDAHRTAGLTRLRHFLLHLERLQQAWERPWQPADRTGALRRANFQPEWNDRSTALGALAFLEGYELTGDSTFLQRGAAALAAAMTWENAAGERSDEPASAQEQALALFASRRTSSSLGQAVVDLPSGRTAALDALWIEHARVAASSIELTPLTVAGPTRARICLRGAAPQPGGYRIKVGGESHSGLSPEALAAGLELPVRIVPSYTFRPPAEIAVDQPWDAFATWSGALAPSAQAFLEITNEPGSQGRVILVADPEAHCFQTAEPFVPHGVEGERWRVRLRVQDGDLVRNEPVHGMRTVAIGPMHCIDPGDDDEHSLLRPTVSRVTLFDNGSENCRALEVDEAATWFVPVPPDATRLRLQILLHGRVRAEAGDRVLQDDREDTDTSVRWLALESTDRRLWQEGMRERLLDGRVLLPLRLQARFGPLQVARIRYLPTGRGAIVTGQVQPAAPVPGLHVAVLPVEFDDLPMTAAALDLQQACFGDRDYTATPAPQPRRTAGSAAVLVRAMSGGDAALHGTVLEPLRITGLAAERCSTAEGRIQLAEAVRQRLRSKDLPADLVVAVLGAAANRWSLEPVDGSPPVVLLPERAPDGSFLPVGSLLSAIVTRGHGLPDLTPADAGAFGQLDLTSCGGGHVPSGLTGSQLVRLGWADRIEVRGGDVEVPALQEDRAFLALAADPSLGRGDLLVEDRRSTAGEPSLSGGVLFTWDLRSAPPLLFGRGEQPSRPRLLRLSPDPDAWPTPWHPGRPSDLFVSAVELDGNSNPSLTTVEGETPWAISMRPGTNRWQLHVRSLAARPAAWDTAIWTTTGGTNKEPAPMPLHLDLGDGGQVTAVDGQLRVTPRRAGQVRGEFALPPPSIPRRLFAVLHAGPGSGSTEVTFSAGTELARVRLEAGARTQLEIDLAGGPPSTRLTLQVGSGAGGGPAVFLDSWLLVPLRTARTWLLPAPAAAASEPWTDGVVRTTALAVSCATAGEPVELPAAMPAGRSVLQLRLGRPAADVAGPLQLDVAMRSRDGAETLQLCTLTLPPGPGPATTALVDLPPRERDSVMFLSLRASGPPGARVFLQSAQIVRP